MQNTVVEHPDSFRDLWGLVWLVGVAFILTVVAIWMIATQFAFWPGSDLPEADLLGVSQTAFAQETGLQVVRVNVTLGGGAIALRYLVVDPDKAVIIHDEDYPPGFVVEATGQVLNLPWHEHSHDRDLHAGIAYYELVKNSGGVLKPGDTVSVLVGEARLENVVVQ